MVIKVAIQMDPVESLKPATDSTILLGREAQARGHALYYYTPATLSHLDGRITARAWPITLKNDPQDFFALGEQRVLDLREMDVLLLRQDPPFNMTYLSTTYILEMLAPDVLVVNDPASVRNHPEKIFPTFFRQFMPPTLISADTQAIAEFRREYKDIVVKPLYGYAGHDVVHVKPGDDLEDVLKAAITPLLPPPASGGSLGGGEPVMVQKFLPEVATGDRRIILIDGEIGGIMARIPAEDDFRANFRVGGHAQPATMSKRQKEICETLGPELKKRGIIFAGIDCIGDYLTEINITSPTGLVAMNRITGQKLEAKIWDAIEARPYPPNAMKPGFSKFGLP